MTWRRAPSHEPPDSKTYNTVLLENKFYCITSVDQTDSLNATYHIALVADCDVYRGHFPGKPVCPGVCNIETIRECASHLVGRRLAINFIKQCRLTAVATPIVCPQLDITVALAPTDAGYTVQATIADAATEYMTLKGELTTA